MVHRLLPLTALLAWGCATEAPDGKQAGDTPVDADGDGFSADEDCDDTDPAVHPDAPELCGGGDEDCDGEIDEDDAQDAPLWYTDADFDGFGGTRTGTPSCVQPPDTLADGGDCDDNDPAIHPDAEEVPCNGISESCEGDGGVRVPEDVATLQLAVDAAETGGYVCVSPGSWAGARITHPVWVQGVGDPDAVVLDGTGRNSLLDIEGAPGTRVQGLTFRDASGTFGAALRVVDSDGVVIIGNRFEGNVALADGGAVSIETSDGVLLTTNQFDDNHAGGSGGALRILDSSHAEVVSNTFSRNSADAEGGAVWLLRATDTVVAGGTLDRNAAEEGGGLAAKDGQRLTFDVVTLSRNTASDSGGGAWFSGETSGLLSDLTVSGNEANSGAAMAFWQSSDLGMERVSFGAHLVETHGGCVLLRTGAQLTVTDSTFDTCSAGIAGGAVALREDGLLSMTGGELVDGFGGVGGGIALVDDGTVLVDGTRFEGNRAGSVGAALHAAGGSLTATGVVFVDNLPDDHHCETDATCSVSEAP